MQIADQAWLAANQLNVPNIGISIQSNGQMSSRRDEQTDGRGDAETKQTDKQRDRERVEETRREKGTHIAGQTDC